MFLLLFLTPKEGWVWTFGFAKLANFWFGFSVFALKICGFSVLVSCAGFLQFSFGNDGGFRIFLSNSFQGFSGFAKEITPYSDDKPVIPNGALI